MQNASFPTKFVVLIYEIIYERETELICCLGDGILRLREKSFSETECHVR